MRMVLFCLLVVLSAPLAAIMAVSTTAARFLIYRVDMWLLALPFALVCGIVRPPLKAATDAMQLLNKGVKG